MGLRGLANVTQFVGRDEIDAVVFGLSRLINHITYAADSTDKASKIPHDFMEAVFRKHLFPEICQLSQNAEHAAQVPNLKSTVRAELLTLVSTLAEDHESYGKLLKLMRELIPQPDAGQAWSWGITQVPDDYTWELNYSIERQRIIRAAPGYTGLRNLSNTCYMNSLLTQLFMNVRFRNFMLRTNVADGEGSQRLLHQTRNLFGVMQDSFLKSVDTQGVADSIVTYDATAIDVNIQMDVDEFYNLLFDRWESQILSDHDKKQFRSFYGGQIVQQIKSRECEHISERTEPFSAIQCDISGKSNLVESLNAYVSGEVMEGDNKYSCTSCGSYVDAVKRACLKDIPDNLIFHLKRFDYDVMTNQRNKVNSRFEFPREIDMSPYHVESLRNHGEQSSPDVFELVGVLVHSGSAESGHYYSYIQERPAKNEKAKTWVEFNDMDVEPFDPAGIDDHCFGGWTDHTMVHTSYPKVWNAYMLFYERMNPTHPLQEETGLSHAVPAKCQLPQDLEQKITYNNEVFLRQYCLFDPAQAQMAKTLLDKLCAFEESGHPVDQATEKEAVEVSLEYLDRILSRTKDSSSLEKMLATMTQTLGSCPRRCRLALSWLTAHDSTLQNLLLRCPQMKVRKDFACMVGVAVKYLRDYEPEAYGLRLDQNGLSLETNESPLQPSNAIFADLAERLIGFWGSLTAYRTAWDEYFGLLAELACLGRPEVHLLLCKGVLLKCLSTLVADSPYGRKIRASDEFYREYAKLIERGKKFSVAKLTALTANLLSAIDFEASNAGVYHDERSYEGGRLGLTTYEEELLCLGSSCPARAKDILAFLDKTLTAGSNPGATKRIIQCLLSTEPPYQMHQLVKNTIQSGVSVDPAALAGPYLKAALVFCESAASSNLAENLLKNIAVEVDSIGKSGGSEHLDFFVQARRLQNPRFSKHKRIFHRKVRQSMPQWAPTLLSYVDETIRQGTAELIQTLLFEVDAESEDDEEQEEERIQAGRNLALACARKGEARIQRQEPLEVPKVYDQMIEITRDCLRQFYAEDSGSQLQQIESKFKAPGTYFHQWPC